MRQFVTWQFWLSLLVLVGLTFGLLRLTRSDELPVATPAEFELVEREVDLVGLVFLAQADPGFDIVDGLTTQRLLIRIDGFRYVDIVAGTPGENRCGALADLAGCVIAANLLGESVLWFSLLPVEPRNELTLPPITQLREGARVLLANGWLMHRAETISRECETDTASLTDFIRRFGETSTTTYSIDDQQVTTVTCVPPG